jgi:hypothetical protein
MRIFDILKSISWNKDMEMPEHSEFEKEYNPFMINRFLSMDANFVHLAQFMNEHPEIPKNLQYLFLTIFSDRKDVFFKYHKPKKINKEDLLLVSKYFRSGKSESETILNMLSEKELKTVKDAFGGKR